MLVNSIKESFRIVHVDKGSRFAFRLFTCQKLFYRSFSSTSIKYHRPMDEIIRECELYEPLEVGSKTLQCYCCNRRCIIEDSHNGFCGVRYNKDGKLFLSVYGHPCALNVDPIEKKPLFHFLPSTTIFSLGTIGCNYRCTFCQNWDISQAVASISNSGIDIEDLTSAIKSDYSYFSPETIVNMAESRGCKSIAFTYNEPTIWCEYAHDIAELAQVHGMRCVYVTNGSMTTEHLKYIRPCIDAMNIDLKAWNPRFYRDVCGGNVHVVRENIKLAKEMGFWVEVTTLVIPGENDSDEELTSIAEFLCSVSPTIPWHLSAFHPDYEMKEKKSTPLSTLLHAREIARKAGLLYVYVGNVRNEGGEDTICPACGETVIARSWFEVDGKSCCDGICRKCGKKVDGIWS